MAVSYREGCVFAVPLRNGEFTTGVVARVTAKNNGGAVLLGYFFGPKYKSVPTNEVIDSLNPCKAIKVLRFGDLSLQSGEWPVIGDIYEWKREEWALPDFVRRDDISRRAWRVSYSDDNLVQPVKEESVSPDSVLERDAMYGSGAVELLLTRLLT
jgi:hypothetical protein